MMLGGVQGSQPLVFDAEGTKIRIAYKAVRWDSCATSHALASPIAIVFNAATKRDESVAVAG